MDTVELIIILIGITIYTPLSAMVLCLLGVLVKYQIIRRLMKKAGAEDTMVQKTFKLFDIIATVAVAVPTMVLVYLAFGLWYLSLIALLEFLLTLWLLSRTDAQDSPTMEPEPPLDTSLLAGASVLYLATRSTSRSRKTEPRHDWIEEEECLDYAALDEDFKDEVDEFFDREDYDF